MVNSYEMLKHYVNAYKNLEYPEDIMGTDVKVIESLNRVYENLKTNILNWAIVLVDEMEGEE